MLFPCEKKKKFLIFDLQIKVILFMQIILQKLLRETKKRKMKIKKTKTPKLLSIWMAYIYMYISYRNKVSHVHKSSYFFQKFFILLL